MGRPKGHPKTGGIVKGTKHQLTPAKEAINDIMDGQFEYIPEVLEYLRINDPNNYLKIIIGLLPYVIAKKTDITTNGHQITMIENKPFHEWAEDDKTE